ncbi:MAG TPA: DUF1499 domain-containing protein [Burkholderiales bacterium]|nr:DUF1499 domain-containing protein [Burkholderiales bacterium]
MLRRALVAMLFVVIGAGAGIALHLASSKGATMFSGKRPDNLGVKEGRLASCGRRLNCVSSQADPGDAQRYVAPIPFKGSTVDALAAARRAVEAMARATVVHHEGNYLHVEFRSRLMGYVDDVEFTYDDKAGVLHLRSASRLGRRDFDVNRDRIEALRARIEGRVQV